MWGGAIVPLGQRVDLRSAAKRRAWVDGYRRLADIGERFGEGIPLTYEFCSGLA